MLSVFKHALVITATAALATVTLPAADPSQSTATDNAGKPAKADSKSINFIKEAAQDNETEISLGQIGAQKGQNPELKTFAQKLQQDHTQANQQLQPLAQKYGVSIDQSLKGKERREVSKLDKEQAGQKFDQAFAEFMLKNHQKDIERFQQAAAELQDPDVRQYASSMLPKLREHFDHAVTVAKAVGVDQSTISSYQKKLPGAVGGTSDSPVGGTSDSQSETTKGAGAKDLKQ